MPLCLRLKDNSAIKSILDAVKKAGYQAEYVLDQKIGEQLAKQKSIQEQQKVWQGLTIGAPYALGSIRRKYDDT